jgi:hypothetical protein
MKSIASLCQINRHASVLALRVQHATLIEAVAELCQALDRIDALLHERAQAHEYAQAAAAEGRDNAAPASYAEIRGM